MEAKIRVYGNKWSDEEQRNEPGVLVKEANIELCLDEEGAVSFRVIGKGIFLTHGSYWLAVPNLKLKEG